jgi:hypothetical protein
VAKQTVIVDDLTGEPGARTRTLRFDGIEYEIDLTEASFADLRAALKPYLRAARAVSGAPESRGGARRRPAGAATGDSAAIRAWARANGVSVTDRGRVAPAVRQAWVAAGSPR